MRILFLSFYFEPDLSAGSFRNTSLIKKLVSLVPDNVTIDVITTMPNRYSSFADESKVADSSIKGVNVRRIPIPKHQNGLLSQIKSFTYFYKQAIRIVKGTHYDLVYASSSRLFTAFLGARIAKNKKAKLYLDIRDIFRESITEIFKNPLIKVGLNFLLRPVECYTFKKATHINLVSPGFGPYFKKYTIPSYSYFTNGIDDIFKYPKAQKTINSTNLKKIVYAGNIGEGQGLHYIIPEAAARLNNCIFEIIGDGGIKNKLESEIQRLKLTNVVLKSPVRRSELVRIYEDADFLFLHLNDYKAFERVLPSKIFEYATFNVPIIAGVGGYANEFIKKEVSNVILFQPKNVESFVRQFLNFTYTYVSRDAFCLKYDREQINIQMSQSIIDKL